MDSGIASHGGAAGGLLIILGWAGGAASSLEIRDRYRRSVGSPFETAVLSAQERLSERDRARRMARERGAGPRAQSRTADLPNTQDAGLIDVTNAPASAIDTLPGVTTRWQPRSSRRAPRPAGPYRSKTSEQRSISTAT
jgi:hypothetical protein